MKDEKNVSGEVPANVPDPTRFTVTVYASSSSMINGAYAEAAHSMGAAIARQGWLQVNGGGNGLMGSCTDGGLAEGGDVDCVILRRFVPSGMANKGKFRDIDITDTMLDRRMGLYRRANAFVAIPGGLGTLEELSEVISWRQLEWHNRIVVLLNTNGFYDSFEQFLLRAIEEKFIAPGMHDCVKFVDTPEEAIKIINEYVPFSIHKCDTLSGNADWIPAQIPNSTVNHDGSR